MLLCAQSVRQSAEKAGPSVMADSLALTTGYIISWPVEDWRMTDHLPGTKYECLQRSAMGKRARDPW